MCKNVKTRFFTIALLFLVLLCACSQKTRAEAPLGLEKVFEEAGLRALPERFQARDFSLALARTGETRSLSSLKGKVVFLNFWATWCGPCRAEMPSMQSLHNKFKDKGLEILAVNCLEKAPQVLSFLDSNGFSFPVALDTDGQVSAAYGIQSIPTSFILDKEGKIVSRLVGSIDWDTPKIHAVFERLLAD